MSKFKIGDKVRVKYIPNVMWTGEWENDLKGIKTISVFIEGYDGNDGPYKLAEDERKWNFSDDSLELVEAFKETTDTTQRTLLGLETEVHLLEKEAAELWKRIWGLRDEIQKLKELEE